MDRPKRTEPSNVTRHAAAQRSETRDADSRSRAAAEPRASSHAPGPHDHRGRLPNSGSVNTPREWTHRDGGTPALPHPSASKRSLHVRRHASHVYSWSGKGFTAGSYCPDKGVRSGSMFALPALTVLTVALLRSASEWSNSLHPDLNAVMNPQAAPHWELARHAAIVAQRRGVLYNWLWTDGCCAYSVPAARGRSETVAEVRPRDVSRTVPGRTSFLFFIVDGTGVLLPWG